MSIYKDGYETTMGSVLVMKPVVEALKVSIIKDNIDHVNLGVKHIDGYKPVFVTGSYDSETDVPLFTHPISILNFQHSNYICADLRFFVRKDSPHDNIENSIKNRTEFNFAKSRAILNLIWVTGGVNSIKNGLSFAGIVFSEWLAEIISKNYALDFKDRTMLNIISHFYYQSLFNEKNEFEQEDKERMAAQTIKATRAPAELVLEVFDKIGKMGGIEDYCTNVTKILENVRLNNFNIVILLTIVKNSWYGTNAKEIIQVALEHPPTWNAIVYTAINERTYKSSTVYRLAERFGKRGAADEFNATYISMVKSQLESDDKNVSYSPYE